MVAPNGYRLLQSILSKKEKCPSFLKGAPQGNQPGEDHEDQQEIRPQAGRTDQEVVERRVFFLPVALSRGDNQLIRSPDQHRQFHAKRRRPDRINQPDAFTPFIS